MLRPWHSKRHHLSPIFVEEDVYLYYFAVASQQYLAIAEMLLCLFNPSPARGHLTKTDLEFAENCALRVCGLARTNDSISAKVNAFGPLAFCECSQGAEHIDEKKSVKKISTDNI